MKGCYKYSDVFSWLLQLINDARHHLVLFTPWWRLGAAQTCWALHVFSSIHVFIKTWFIFFNGIAFPGLSSGSRRTLHTAQFIWKWNWIKYFFYIKHTCVWYITSVVKMYLPGYVAMKKNPKNAEMCRTCPQWPCQDVAWVVEVRGWFATPASLVMSSLNNRRVPRCCCLSRNHCVRISWNIPNSDERKRNTGRQKKCFLFSFLLRNESQFLWTFLPDAHL